MRPHGVTGSGLGTRNGSMPDGGVGADGGRRSAPVSGVLRFTRYAYPPNVLGYCGPGDHQALLEYASAGVADPGLDQLARGFDGAWPYLALIAAANGDRDPLDDDVVSAYWIGNDLLAHVPGDLLVRHLEDRFRPRVAGSVGVVVGPVLQGGVAHHSLHVLGVTPWIGLLRAGQVDPAMEVVERCLVRWGRVATVPDAGWVEVTVPTIMWDGLQLSLGPTRVEQFRCEERGHHLADVQVDDLVGVHWEWVCDRLTPSEAAQLAWTTRHNLAAVQRARVHPAAAT